MLLSVTSQCYALKTSLCEWGPSHLANDVGESLQCMMFKEVLRTIGNRKESSFDLMSTVQIVQCIFGPFEEIHTHMDKLLNAIKAHKNFVKKGRIEHWDWKIWDSFFNESNDDMPSFVNKTHTCLQTINQ